ncbi:hypothetical protein [Sansalvadorimonas verongulae]|uniref:hypothetical protein n=1 Tax=Sansalvadorimonas verongulae TaxID=2172824 RepID=UPI0012BC5BC9|nr:hypothetical protein [Sansalvadorimonas verongulae]MTI13351.1 hypothetical protein [Sansalvadorimonas verongulae]
MPLLSTNKLHELTGKTHRTIKARLENIEPVVDGRSHLYDSREVLPLLYDVDKTEGDYDLETERARLAKEQADGKALENAKKRKEQLDVASMVELVSDEYAFVRSRAISLPGKLSRQLALMDSPTEIEELLLENISEALEEMCVDEPGVMEARVD